MLEDTQKGYADRQIANLLGCLESQVHNKRLEMGIKRTYKLVDTCAAEFESFTPYYYSTYDHENESTPSQKKNVIILGGGPNRIGQGIEFPDIIIGRMFKQGADPVDPGQGFLIRYIGQHFRRNPQPKPIEQKGVDGYLRS